jgi:hypothetical protein
MKRVFILALFLLSGCIIYCQEYESLKERISGYYKNFEYKKVITLAESLITSDTKLPSPLLMDLFLLKALSHYNRGEEIAAQISFIALLELNHDFELDPVENSPKIIHFFKQVKEEYLKQQEQIQVMEPESVPSDSSIIQVQKKSVIVRSALLRSAVLPGWGHRYLKKKTKGVIFNSLAVSTALAAIYYTFYTHNKEDDYLHEINITKIEKRYRVYNNAYKVRNVFISSYLFIWLYTQFDLLTFQDQKIADRSAGILIQPSCNYYNCFTLNLSFSL